MVAGKNVTPSDHAATERLMLFWSTGEGGTTKIRWPEPGAFERCKTELSKYVGPDIVSGLCANLAHRATGTWPGSKEYLTSHGRKS